MSTGAGWQQAAVTPQLEVISCGSFSATPIWDDRGTGARGDGIAFWRVVPPPGYWSIGDYAENAREAKPKGTALVVREAVGAKRDRPLLAPPVDYVKVWDDRGTGGKYGNVSLWRPVPPTGFVALGDIATNSHSDRKPPLDLIRCVHDSLVTIGRWDYPLLWSDSGSGGSYGDVSVWRPAPKDPFGVATTTFKSDWAHCFPLLFPPYVLKDQTKLSQRPPSAAEHDDEPRGRKITLMSHCGRFLRLKESREAFTAVWSGAKDHQTSGEPEEAWTMILKENWATFRSKHGLYLSCKPSGELEGVPELSGEREEFEVDIVNERISIKSYLGKYVTVPRTADSDLVAAEVVKPYSWTVCFLPVTSGASVVLISKRGLYMSAQADGNVVLVERNPPGPTERWTLNEDQRRLTLLSHWGYFMSAVGENVSARSETVGDAERFRRYQCGPAQLSLNSKELRRQVSAQGGRVELSKSVSDDSTWTVLLTYDSRGL